MIQANNTTKIFLEEPSSSTLMFIEEEDEERNINNMNFFDEDEEMNNSTIYRYKLSDEIITALHYFAKVHQYDDRKDFKAAWLIFVEENKDLVNKESNRLNELNYDGDILGKMFVSARYYFRKKNNVKKEPQKRRSYIGVDYTLIEAMDKHISENIVLKPSQSFDKFCGEYIELLQKEVTNLYKNGMLESENIKMKIKKTYKNRHFLMTQKK